MFRRGILGILTFQSLSIYLSYSAVSSETAKTVPHVPIVVAGNNSVTPERNDIGKQSKSQYIHEQHNVHYAGQNGNYVDNSFVEELFKPETVKENNNVNNTTSSQPVHQAMNPPSNRSVTQAVNHPANQPVQHPVYQQVPVHPTAHQTANQTVYQSAYQQVPVQPPIHQAVNSQTVNGVNNHTRNYQPSAYQHAYGNNAAYPDANQNYYYPQNHESYSAVAYGQPASHNSYQPAYNHSHQQYTKPIEKVNNIKVIPETIKPNNVNPTVYEKINDPVNKGTRENFDNYKVASLFENYNDEFQYDQKLGNVDKIRTISQHNEPAFEDFELYNHDNKFIKDKEPIAESQFDDKKHTKATEKVLDNSFNDRWEKLMENFVPQMVVTFKMSGIEQEVFYQYVHEKGLLIRGGRFENKYGNLDYVTLTILSPSSKVIYQSTERDSIFSFVADEIGEYSIILNADFYSSSRYITFLLGVGSDTQLSSTELSSFSKTILNLKQKISNIETQSSIYWNRKRNQIESVKEITKKTKVLFMIEFVAIITIAALQY